MSLHIVNKTKEKYPLINPLIQVLKHKKLGFNTLVDIVNKKGEDPEVIEVAFNAIKGEHPSFKNKPRHITRINIAYDTAIAKAEEEFKGVCLYYEYPSHPEIHSLINRYSTNGKMNTDLFEEGKMDPNAQTVFLYDAAKIYLVGWEGIIGIDGEGKDVAFPFGVDAIQSLPTSAIQEFGSDILIPYINKVINGEKVSIEGIVEEDPIPN